MTTTLEPDPAPTPPTVGIDRAALLRTWAGATMISFSAVWVRLADVEAGRSAFLRGLYALPAFALILWWQRRRGGAASGGRIVVPLAVVSGMMLGLDLVSWHASIGIVGAGIGTVLPNLQIVLVGVLGVVVFNERPGASFWYAVPLVLAGVWLIGAVGKPVEAGASVLLGVGLGVLTAVFYAGYLVIMRAARMRHAATGPVEILASVTIGAVLVTGLVAVFEGVASPPASLSANGWLVLLALGSQVVGWLLLTSSIHRLPVVLTAVALLLQPVLSMVWATLILHEPIGLAQIAGAAIVLVGVAIAHRAVVNAPDVAVSH